MLKQSSSLISKARTLSLLIEAGWPKAVGLNDKRHASHNHMSLDRQPVDTFWTSKAKGFFALDRAKGIVTWGETRDAALIAMVNARESASR